jgi:hypothetical protein
LVSALEANYDELLSSFAFKFNLRCYIEAAVAQAMVDQWDDLGATQLAAVGPGEKN